MTTNLQSNKAPKKKMGCFKIGLLVLGGLIVLFIGGMLSMKDEEKKKDADDIVKLKQDSIQRVEKFKNGWQGISEESKKQELDSLITSKSPFYKKQRNQILAFALTAVKSYVKYPETIEYQSYGGKWNGAKIFTIDSYNTSISDVNKGVILIQQDFKSENKLGVPVRNTLSLKVDFTGKTTGFSGITVK